MKMNKNLSQKIKYSAALFAAAFLITSCLTDGPNQTGAEFLREDGHILSRDLDSISMEYPVDSFFTESLEPSHLGSLYWLVGSEEGFEAESRFAYYVAPTVLDSAEDLKIALRFQSFGTTNSAIAKKIGALDSLKLIVRAFTFDSLTTEEDKEEIDAEIKDLKLEKDMLARDYLALWDPDSNIVALQGSGDSLDVVSQDTLTLGAVDSGKEFYTRKFSLPNLFQLLKSKDDENEDLGHWLFLEIDLAEGQADVGMFRLATYFANRDSSLQFEWPAKTGDSESNIRIKFSDKITFNYNSISPSPRGVSYRLSHPDYQTNPSILSGKAQGLHILIDRDNFLEALAEKNPVFKPGSEKDTYINNYFVPYSEISVPFDSVYVENDARLTFNLISQLDSVLDSGDEAVYNGESAFSNFNLSDSEKYSFTIYNTLNNKKLDDLTVSLGRDDAGHKQAYFEYADNEKQNDTLFLPDSGIVEYSHRYINNLTVLRVQFSIHVLEDSSYQFFYWTEKRATLEPNGEGGNVGLDENYHKFLSNESEALTLRNTYGMQRLVNLNFDKDVALFDFFFSPSDGAILENSLVQKLGYPVLAKAPLTLNDQGKLVVTIKLYFYELDP